MKNNKIPLILKLAKVSELKEVKSVTDYYLSNKIIASDKIIKEDFFKTKIKL